MVESRVPVGVLAARSDGYKYSEGAAVEAVREQIRKQEDEIIPRFAAEGSMGKQRNGILVSSKTQSGS